MKILLILNSMTKAIEIKISKAITEKIIKIKNQ